MTLTKRAIHECDQLRSEVSSSQNNPRHTLFQLDAISRTVCNVIDAAELARSTHASAEWRDAAQRAFVVLQDYIAQLNGDFALYQALLTTRPAMNTLTEEEKRFVSLLQAEFERDGIHLLDDQREQIRQIQNQLTELETLFSRNIVTAKHDFWADAAAVQTIIPRQVLQSHFGLGQLDGPNIRLCQSSSQVLQTLLKYSSSPSLRRQVYLESTTAVPENLPVLESLMETRHALAQRLGFPSYAHRFLQHQMAGSPGAVQTFLSQLQQRLYPVYQKDMQLLSKLKSQLEGNAQIEPWDVSFYTALIQAQQGFDVSSEVSQYLSLEQCIRSLQSLVQTLFGITMNEEDLTESEQWDVTTAGSRSRIRRFAFAAEDGRPLGIMYMDLHPREGKYTHAAHFTVRCGCQTDFNTNDYQFPIIALVCNLSSGTEDYGPLLLSHGEVETLFHEFGHGLHSLLSRTRFQHMSGTRGAMDFVETPSHLLEHVAWDADLFLRPFTAHHATGQSMPEDLILKLQQSRYAFSTIERYQQVLYARLDQQLFGPVVNQSTTRVFADLHHQLGIPYAAGTHWHSRFGHLVTYGAGYYGYLYAQVFAGDVWQHLFAHTQNWRRSGDVLWHGLLQHGGAKDPAVMLNDILSCKL
jgi:intermediate peptidase